jgi:hypothetical protein
MVQACSTLCGLWAGCLPSPDRVETRLEAVLYIEKNLVINLDFGTIICIAQWKRQQCRHVD